MKPLILVVDDEEEICDYVRDILADEGYVVKQAFCGEDLDKTLKNNQFNIAFIDLRLSTAMSGLDIIKFLKEQLPDIKIVAMTGYVDAHLKLETEKLGVSMFLEKPFKPNQVINAVNCLK